MTVNILGITYKVIQLDLIDNDTNIKGKIDFHKQTILLKKELNHDVKYQTLIHEITHAILHQLGLYTECEDEQLIQSLATGFYQVSKDNDLLTLFTT